MTFAFCLNLDRCTCLSYGDDPWQIIECFDREEDAVQFEPWVIRVEHAGNCVWLRQDGYASWLITRDFRMSPEFYLSVEGHWSPLATGDCRHDQDSARSLALAYLLETAEEM